jgi:hypothetical protein
MFFDTHKLLPYFLSNTYLNPTITTNHIFLKNYNYKSYLKNIYTLGKEKEEKEKEKEKEKEDSNANAKERKEMCGFTL